MRRERKMVENCLYMVHSAEAELEARRDREAARARQEFENTVMGIVVGFVLVAVLWGIMIWVVIRFHL